MFNVTNVLLHNLLQTNPRIRHNFSTQVFTASMSAGVRTLAGRDRFFSNTRTISFILLEKSVKCLFARSPPCTKVCTKTSLSRYYTLCFCIKQHSFHLLICSQPPFYKLVIFIAFSMNYSIHSQVCNIDTMVLQF